MKPDPPVRPDGRCAICGRMRGTHRSAKYAPGQADLDPFDSTECCRKWHGTEIPSPRATADGGDKAIDELVAKVADPVLPADMKPKPRGRRSTTK